MFMGFRRDSREYEQTNLYRQKMTGPGTSCFTLSESRSEFGMDFMSHTCVLYFIYVPEVIRETVTTVTPL